MSDMTKKAQPWETFVRVIGHVASSMLMTAKGNLPEELIDICFGESLINRFMQFALIASLADSDRYISDKAKKVKFTDEKGNTKGFGYTDEDKLLNEKALAWEPLTSVIVEDGFLIYGGNVELRFNIFFKDVEKGCFQKGEKVHDVTLDGLNLFLSTWFTKPRDKDGKYTNHPLTWTFVPAAEDFYVLSVKGLTPRQRYRAKK